MVAVVVVLTLVAVNTALLRVQVVQVVVAQVALTTATEHQEALIQAVAVAVVEQVVHLVAVAEAVL